MIIKSKSYKHLRSFTTVPRYILREQERDKGFVLTKFIKGKDVSAKSISLNLLINESYRLNPRKNNVRLYMDILSFHKEDSQHLTNDKLQKIALKYLSLRAPRSLAFATVHRHDKQHTHLHICFSGVEYKTGKNIRISKNDFQNKVKIPMEQYQRKNFPELYLSEINHHIPAKPNQKEHKRDVEKTMEQKGKISEKQHILKILETCYKKASSRQDFFQKLTSQNIKLYSRNGVITGIQSKRKFRFKTLGYTPEILSELDKNIALNKRLEILKKLRQNTTDKERFHEQ